MQSKPQSSSRLIKVVVAAVASCDLEDHETGKNVQGAVDQDMHRGLQLSWVPCVYSHVFFFCVLLRLCKVMGQCHDFLSLSNCKVPNPPWHGQHVWSRAVRV